MNLPAQQSTSTLPQQIAALTEQLAAPTNDEIERCLNGLMDGGMMFPASIMAADKVAEYRKALSGAPVVGLRKVFVKLKRGEYENINLAFIPLPAEFAAMSRAEARTQRDDLLRLRETAKALEEQSTVPEPRDPAMAERIRRRLTDFRAVQAAQKAAETSTQEPMTDEKADYYRKILELRDAPQAGVEHAAFKRSIINQFPEEERKAAE